MEQEKLSLRGTIRGVTSDPTSYGKPTRVDIQGKRPKLALTGILDHTAATPVDTVSLDLKGYPLEGFRFSENPLSLSNITRGFLDLKANLALRGDPIDLKTRSTAKNLVLNFLEEGKGNLMVNMVTDALKTTPSLSIGVAARGTRDNPQLSISSDIDRLFADQLKNFAGKKVNELRASLGAQIDGASGKEMKGFSDFLAQGKVDISKQFGSDESLVQGKIDLLSGVVASKTGKPKTPTKGKEKGYFRAYSGKNKSIPRNRQRDQLLWSGTPHDLQGNWITGQRWNAEATHATSCCMPLVEVNDIALQDIHPCKEDGEWNPLSETCSPNWEFRGRR